MQATLVQQVAGAPFLPAAPPYTFTTKSRNHDRVLRSTRSHRSVHSDRHGVSSVSTSHSTLPKRDSGSAYLTPMPPYVAPPGFYPPLPSTAAMHPMSLLAPAGCPPPPGSTIPGSWPPVPHWPTVHSLGYQQPEQRPFPLTTSEAQTAPPAPEQVTPTVYDPQLNENVSWRSEEREDGTAEIIRVRPDTKYRPERWLPFVRCLLPCLTMLVCGVADKHIDLY